MSFVNNFRQSFVEQQSRVEVQVINESEEDGVMEKCSEILRYKNLLIAPPAGAKTLWCDATYDNLLCWPAIPANTSISLPCPSGPGLNPFKHVTKFCHWSGQWRGQDDEDFSSPFGFTDYSVCRTPSYLKKYEMVVPPVDAVETATEYTFGALEIIPEFGPPEEIPSSPVSTTFPPLENLKYNSTHHHVKLYNVRNLELAGLVLSLISLIVLCVALLVSKRIQLRVNKIRLQVVGGITAMILVMLILDFWLSYTAPSDLINVISVVLLSILELGKCLMCVWVLIECLHIFLHVKLSDWEDLSFWCYFIPGCTVSIIAVVIWLLVTYFTCETRVEEPASCITDYDAQSQYWILRSIHLAALTSALLVLFCAVITLTNEKSRASDFKKVGEAFLTFLVVTFIGLAIILPFVSDGCKRHSTLSGCVTCFFVYFLGFFVSIIYAIAQIVSPWWNYIAVLDEHNRPDAF